MIILVEFLWMYMAQARLPSWSAPQPNPKLPLGGYKPIADAVNIEVFHADSVIGSYNHAGMLSYHQGWFLLAWKNSLRDEDSPGQRILYSQSDDGLHWTKTDGNNVLFPNMSTTNNPVAQFVGPSLVVNGRLYTASSPGINAQGFQFCLWPDPLDPRNCGPPGQKQPHGVLMLRQVFGMGKLGPIFWATREIPKGFEDASKLHGIRTLDQMDTQTQLDIANLSSTMEPPCPNPRTSGTLKCESCSGGCQLWSTISTKLKLANERAHWVLNGPEEKDVIVYRSHSHALFASVRYQNGTWSYPTLTNIPNDDTNINAGLLPDGRVFLVSNPLYFSGTSNSPKMRDPCTIATSTDGYTFDKVGVVITCTALSTTSTCEPRFVGKSKNRGPSYPQALTVVDPAPIEHQGIYIVTTNNKEDVWITKLNFSSF